MTGHLVRLCKTEQVEHGRSQVSQNAALSQSLDVVAANESQRNRVGGVCGKRRLAVCLEHLVSVAVVSGDQCAAAVRLEGFQNAANTGINCLNSLNCCRNHTGVTNHIAVCEVEDDDIVLVRLDALYNLIGYLERRHLRLEIVGCDRGRLDECTLFVLVLTLYTAVEEERNMCVLLSLSDTQLGQTLFCDVLAEGVR